MSLRKIHPGFYKPEISFGHVDNMLYELAGKDLTKISALRNVKKKILWHRYYLNQVDKLNELIEQVEYLKSVAH